MSIARHNTHNRHRITRAHHASHLRKRGIHRPVHPGRQKTLGGGRSKPMSIRKIITAIANKLGVSFR